MKILRLALFVILVSSLRSAPLAWKDTTYTTHEKAKTQVRGQAATLIAPEDPEKPTGAQVQLALLRLPASTKSPAAPIIYLHGGPGGAGTAVQVDDGRSGRLRRSRQAQQGELDLGARGFLRVFGGDQRGGLAAHLGFGFFVCGIGRVFPRERGGAEAGNEDDEEGEAEDFHNGAVGGVVR